MTSSFSQANNNFHHGHPHHGYSNSNFGYGNTHNNSNDPNLRPIPPTGIIQLGELRGIGDARMMTPRSADGYGGSRAGSAGGFQSGGYGGGYGGNHGMGGIGDAADGAGDYSARQPPSKYRYVPNLLYATFSLAVHTLDVVSSLILAATYLNNGFTSAGVSIFVIFGIRALIQILIEWTNHGRCRYLLLDLLYLRIFAEYWRYVGQWKLHMGRPWRRKEFRATCRYIDCCILSYIHFI
jgi:hypothetical protein